MKKDFETILDESLSRLKQKESVESCLRRYPHYATQLEPLLRTALRVEVLKDTEPPSAKAMAAGRERFLREAARLRAESPSLQAGPRPGPEQAAHTQHGGGYAHRCLARSRSSGRI